MFGVDLSRTPNSLNTMLAAPPLLPPLDAGIGSSPPARKYTSLPGRVVDSARPGSEDRPSECAAAIGPGCWRLVAEHERDGVAPRRRDGRAIIVACRSSFCGFKVLRLAQSPSAVRLISARTRTRTRICRRGHQVVDAPSRPTPLATSIARPRCWGPSPCRTRSRCCRWPRPGCPRRA